MSLIKAIKAQLGLSGTATNNFTLDASAADGTMKLARGNAGATTQDIMTVDANGKPRFNQLAQSLVGNGYKVLEGGLIIQWGTVAIDPNALGTWNSGTYSFPVAFPTAAVSIAVSSNNPGISNTPVFTVGRIISATQYGLSAMSSSASAPTGLIVSWIAIGY